MIPALFVGNTLIGTVRRNGPGPLGVPVLRDEEVLAGNPPFPQPPGWLLLALIAFWAGCYYLVRR